MDHPWTMTDSGFPQALAVNKYNNQQIQQKGRRISMTTITLLWEKILG